MIENRPSHRWIGFLVEAFLKGNLSVILIFISLIAGGIALWITPREEDPQIVVPVADVLVSMPGASAREVERQVASRLEQLLYQIDGVKNVYSMSFPSRAVVTVRFFVGEDRERSWVKVYNKIHSNIDRVPRGVTGWVVKPVEIDDVPIVSLSLYSDRYSDYELRRMAEELEIRLQGVENAGITYLVGGRPRQITVSLSPQRMAGHGISYQDIRQVIQAADAALPAGNLVNENREVRLDAGQFFTSADEVSNLVVGVRSMRPVYLKDVAEVHDGPADPITYTRLAFGENADTAIDPAGTGALTEPIERFRDYPAVTVAVAKRKGSNAVWVSEGVREEARRFAREVLPEGVYLRITRDFGRSANDKVNDLVEALAIAIIIVLALLTYALGWREALIISLAVPVTFSFTLLINHLLGYTINRVTLFALILSLGLVVDDPIVDVENIHRHFAMRKESPFAAVKRAINEVLPPVILATLAVIISFLPMFYITGMMGPYMAPMALNVPVAMLMSLLVSFSITPWLSLYVLKGGYEKPQEKPYVLEETLLYRIYRAVAMPIISYRNLRWAILVLVAVLLAFSAWLVISFRVPLKMLPFDNKNELQVVVDMPEGTTLETTEAATHALADYLVRVPEVTDVSTYVGTHSPVDFNGLVRHYYLRHGSNAADIRINLVAKKHRVQQSHALALRLRDRLTEIARRWNANIKIVEAPPGPPVIATLVAEIYGKTIGQPYEDFIAAAPRVEQLMREIPAVVDVDDTLLAPEARSVFEVDRTKATLNGILNRQVAEALQGTVMGAAPGALHLGNQINPPPVTLRFPRRDRMQKADLNQLMIGSPAGVGTGVFLSDIGTFRDSVIEQPIYHKNLKPLVYVFGDTAGLPPPKAIFMLEDRTGRDPALSGVDISWTGEGEWHITLQVFRDLGIAFAAAVLGIYILLLYQTRSYLLPAIQLIALPLSVIGIVPGFWLLNKLATHPVSGWQNPIYFTATAMIGMIALSGIATRNAILLIDFVEKRKADGKPLVDSLIEAGALRTRPIILTSLAAMLAAWPITLDPVFSGLAWALIFGITVSTLFTLFIVPMVYYMAYRKKFQTPEPPSPL
ncbi:MAG: efflux RND transporter permease subunit [Desulfobacterales bacterium]